MPTINEVMAVDDGNMDTSAETSLQISSTSPAQAPQSRPLQVKKSNTKSSGSRTSSASSLSGRPPITRSHRGQKGSLVPTPRGPSSVASGSGGHQGQGVVMPVQVNQEVEIHQHDQRTTTSNQFDQRSNAHNADQRSGLLWITVACKLVWIPSLFNNERVH